MKLASQLHEVQSGIDKRKIINFLLVISFPIFGFGNYVSATQSPSSGYLVSISPHLLILLFYLIDVLYHGSFRFRLNLNYLLMFLFLFSSALSLFIALRKNLPEANFLLAATKSILLIAPFHAFVVVTLYNEKKKDLVRLLVISLSLLLAINLIGFYVLGLDNEVHSIDGRINFPFLDGIYSGACLIAIINLLLLYYLKQHRSEPLGFATLVVYFMFNMLLFILINSRLTILVFVMVLAFSALGMLRMKGLYILSMATVPILMVSGTIIYKILQLPGLAAILQRVDVEDVTTFNGRAFLWRDALDWLFIDQRGLLFGNGYKGHYFIDLISDVAKLWNEKNIHHMHLHSTSLEILVSQGILFFGVFAILLFQIYKYYKGKNRVNHPEGALLSVVIFLLFILQVDEFVYIDGLGFVVFALLVANISINQKKQEFKPIDISQSLIENSKLTMTYSLNAMK